MRETAGQRTRALTLLLALIAPLGTTALHTAPPEGDPPPAGVVIEETETETAPERLALLPLQDRTGSTDGAVIEEELGRWLTTRYALVPSERIREALRRSRIRDSSSIPPASLERLAADLGCDLFFSATLHHIHTKETPQMTLSGRLFALGSDDLLWAGFESASGLDEMTWLGRGRSDSLEQIARVLAYRLTSDMLNPWMVERQPARPARDAFVLEARPVAERGTIAVIPFDVLTDFPGASEIATDVAIATLFRHGARIAPPGHVEAILRQRDMLLRGEIDALTRAALAINLETDVLFTGMVEALDLYPRGTGPEPVVALSARLVDAETGRIVWTAGQERSGWQNAGAFQRDRVYAVGTLAEEIMESLVASLDGPASKGIEREDH